MWLTSMVINVQGKNYYTTMWWRGSPHVWLMSMVIKRAHLLLYGGREPSRVAQVHGYLPQIAYFTHFSMNVSDFW